MYRACRMASPCWTDIFIVPLKSIYTSFTWWKKKEILVDITWVMVAWIAVGVFQLYLDQEARTDGLLRPFWCSPDARCKMSSPEQEAFGNELLAARHIHHIWEALMMETVGRWLGLRETKQRLSCITGLRLRAGDRQTIRLSIKTTNKSKAGPHILYLQVDRETSVWKLCITRVVTV